MTIDPRVLLRLYPRSWRSRYGSELLALIGSAPVDMRVAIDVALQAATEWRRVSGVDVWLLPLLISGSALFVGRALAARMPAPPVVHWLDLVASLVWTALIVSWAASIMKNATRHAGSPTVLPRLSVAAARGGLVAAFVVGVAHFWLPNAMVLWVPLMVIGNPTFMIAMFVGITRHAYGRSAIWKSSTSPRPPQHPLELD